MNNDQYVFPFGSKLQKVEQKDKSKKKAFFLGVYASAVHAQWKDIDNTPIVKALAIASEPEIFWTGNNAETIISSIYVPEELGYLCLPDSQFNGPSGKILDSLYLSPLNLSRDNSWLCDLLQYSRVNPVQRIAIEKNYNPLVKKYNLPVATIPDFNSEEVNSSERGIEILEELENSEAEIIITLGQDPLFYFINKFSNKKYASLASVGNTNDSYGRTQEIAINNRSYNLLALCHPRQSGRLGHSSSKWHELHKFWKSNTSKQLI